jgi:hypothetical protein
VCSGGTGGGSEDEKKCGRQQPRLSEVRLAAPEPEAAPFLRFEAARTGILLMMNLLEPVVFEIQRHTPYATDPIPTEIA